MGIDKTGDKHPPVYFQTGRIVLGARLDGDNLAIVSYNKYPLIDSRGVDRINTIGRNFAHG